MSTVNNAGLLKAAIRMSRTGAWHADIEAESVADFSDGVTFEVDGVRFVGTAKPGRYGLNGTRMIGSIVGGAGGLSSDLGAKSYEMSAGVLVRNIVADILRETGETLSSTAESAVLGRRLPRWHRVQGPASHSLTKLAAHIGADWRVLADGTVWIGVESWPEANVEHVLEDEDWTNGVITIAPTAPSLTPGVTFLEQRVESVVHTIDEEGRLRTDCHTASTRSAFSRMMGRIKLDIDYSRFYRCRVVTQNADGTLQLDPDDERIKAKGLDKVRIRPGTPGTRIRVSSGARCMLGFEGGDPSKPYAAEWDSETPFDSIDFGPNGLGVARQADITMMSVTLVQATDTGAPIPGCYWMFISPAAPMPSTFVHGVGGILQLYGCVSTASAFVKAK